MILWGGQGIKSTLIPWGKYRAVEQGLVRRGGQGTKNEPFPYRLPDQKFPKNPVEALIAEKSRKVQRELSRLVFDVDFDATHPPSRRTRSG